LICNQITSLRWLKRHAVPSIGYRANGAILRKRSQVHR
jgi:hypothetical protein